MKFTFLLLVLAALCFVGLAKPCAKKGHGLHRRHKGKGHKGKGKDHAHKAEGAVALKAHKGKGHKGKGHKAHKGKGHGKGKRHHAKEVHIHEKALPATKSAPAHFLEVMTGRPDPTCRTGKLSLDSTVCCAGFCGECSDYPTCSSVRGQNSEGQCCKTKVKELECGGGSASANECLKPCSKTNPPCIMDTEVTQPEVSRHAGDDCGEGGAAIEDWRAQAENAVGHATEDYYYYYYANPESADYEYYNPYCDDWALDNGFC